MIHSVNFIRKNVIKKILIPNELVLEKETFIIDTEEVEKHGGNSFVMKAYGKTDKETYAIKFMLFGNRDEVKTLKKISEQYPGNESFAIWIDKKKVNLKYKEYSNIADLKLDENFDLGNQNITCYAMKYAERNLREYLCEEELTADTIKSHIYDLSQGLANLHKIEIKHLDIKPDNILFNNGSLVFTDFGCSTNKQKCKITKTPATWPIPELVEPCIDAMTSEIDAKKTDIFELGCIFFYLITKSFPIGIYKTLEEVDIDNSLKEIIESMLFYDIDSRLENGEVLLNKVEDYLAK